MVYRTENDPEKLLFRDTAMLKNGSKALPSVCTNHQKKVEKIVAALKKLLDDYIKNQFKPFCVSYPLFLFARIYPISAVLQLSPLAHFSSNPKHMACLSPFLQYS